MDTLFKSFRRADGRDYAIRPATLAFRTPDLEAAFRRAYFRSNLQIGRVCHLLAIFFFVTVGLWNALVVDPSALTTWIVVILSVSSIFLCGLAASYVAQASYARYWQPLFAFYVLATGIGFSFVSITSGPRLSIFNFVGIIFCLFFCYTFIRLTFVWATAAGNAVVLIYIGATGIFIEQALRPFLTASFYMFGVNLLGMMVCYTLELMSRRDFMLNELLIHAQDETRRMNVHLEQRVAERTRELNRSNEELVVAIRREKELVARLEAEEKRLQMILASMEQAERLAKLGYFETDRSTGMAFWSKGFYRLVGEAAGPSELSLEAALAYVHPEDRQRIETFIQGRGAGEPRTSVRAEFRLVRQSGSVIETQGIADAFYDPSGALVRVRGVLEDITERKQAEAALRKMEGQLIQAQKMESVGRLAGGVAHDYNNISGIIIGYAELTLDKLPANSPSRRYLEEILAAAQRAAAITRQLLAFARKQTIAPKVINLNRTVEGMLKILGRLIGENIELAWFPGTRMWPVKIDPSQVDQILANLCVNARDAISDVGKVSIETGAVHFDAEYCATHAGFIPGDFASLVVSDNGKGMSSETLDKVFEPFFTTKAVGQGTGLGLATVYGIVKQNQGFINVYSEPGKGATVKIYLPRHLGEAVAPMPERSEEIPAGGGETLLLVEDDISILTLASRMLTGLGYRVLSANTPEEALQLARRHQQTIRLLITDVVMPRMNGRELARQLKAVCPGLRTLYISGYTANVIAHHGVLEAGIHFLSKPFSKRDLAAKVQQTLGA